MTDEVEDHRRYGDDGKTEYFSPLISNCGLEREADPLCSRGWGCIEEVDVENRSRTIVCTLSEARFMRGGLAEEEVDREAEHEGIPLLLAGRVLTEPELG